MSSQSAVFKPIGYVKTEAVGDQVKDRTRTSQIIIEPQFAAALHGITDYSHLYVLFWLHEISDANRMMLQVHPRGRTDLPLIGAFATRTQLRPNPIGLTVVELMKAEGNVLTVRGLDAFNGTPVLDIKPYDNWDIAKNPKMPAWWKKLEEEKPAP
jgi:tRNA-Thr(GGU) m(6)t(6)A37 methyltransferase TsaA